jgi:hypothetical protein
MKEIRRNKDLLFAALKMSGGPLLVERFKQEVLPRLDMNSKWADTVISEEEYQNGVVQIGKELPYFLHWMLSNEFPNCPSS